MTNIENILQDKNVRPTAMRLLVYKALLEKNIALSLNELEDVLGRADRTTLYRTIKTFEDSGIVHAIEDGSGIVKYALCSPYCNAEAHRDLHLHFTCKICEETTCLTEYNIPQIKLPDNYLAEDVNLMVSGICKNCHS